MAETEWTLTYTGTALSMGLIPSNIWLTTPPVIGPAELTNEDGQRARQDGASFGADFRGGRAIDFEIGVNGPSETEALDRAAVLTKAWRGDSIRKTAGELATLTIKQPGRTRVVFGRPRRLAPVGTSFQHQGYLSYIGDFACTDDVFYSSTLTSTTGGAFTVAGDLPAWPIVVVNGPSTNPVVNFGAFSLALNYTIPSGKSVTINTVPWVRSVKTSDGLSIPGKLVRTTRLSRASLAPGGHTVSLTGGGTLNVSWRTSYSSL